MSLPIILSNSWIQQVPDVMQLHFSWTHEESNLGATYAIPHVFLLSCISFHICTFFLHKCDFYNAMSVQLYLSFLYLIMKAHLKSHPSLGTCVLSVSVFSNNIEHEKIKKHFCQILKLWPHSFCMTGWKVEGLTVSRICFLWAFVLFDTIYINSEKSGHTFSCTDLF